MPEGLCLEGSLAEKGKVEGFPLGLGITSKLKNLTNIMLLTVSHTNSKNIPAKLKYLHA
jgi:hypothetical protein